VSYNSPVNDRLPYADVSIAAVLVVVGIALVAYPWLGGVTFLVGAVAAIAVLAAIVGRRPDVSRGVVTDQILDVTSRAAR
jgi:sorbitol-specific phosphotransferase system component IIC